MIKRFSKELELMTLCIFIAGHFVLSYLYGLKIPWGGDEWYSYQDFTLSGLPFSLQVWLLKTLFPELNAHNYHLYRASNFIWSFLSYGLLLFFYFRNPQRKQLALYMLVFFSLSPFIMGVEQFFRYYNLYLFFALLWFWAILLLDNNFSKYRIYFYLGAVLSIFIHFLLFWGIIFYILIKELSELSVKWKWIGGIILVFGVTVMAVWGSPILTFIFELAGNGNYRLPNNVNIIRGFSLALAIKPFFAFFTFVFGEIVLPLENHFVNVLYPLTLIAAILALVTLRKDITALRLVFSACLIPFFGLYWFVEPLTLPGMTQFEPKHAMFAFPWIIYLWHRVLMYKNGYMKTFSFFPLIASAIGVFIAFGHNDLSWNKAINTIESQQGPVIYDGRASADLKFYGKNTLSKRHHLNLYDTGDVLAMIDTADNICIVTKDFKSYQLLELHQMWNSASGSSERFSRIQRVYEALLQDSFQVCASYVHHPLFVYCFSKKYNDNRVFSGEAVPWFYPMYYKDLKWPRIIHNNKMHGFYPMRYGDSMLLKEQKIVHFIQVLDEKKLKSPVLKVVGENGKEELIYINGKPSDNYIANYSRGLKESKTVDWWHKRPLISSSHRFLGSIWPSIGYIFEWTPSFEVKYIVIINDGVVLNYVL